jgi:hypothetical protein
VIKQKSLRVAELFRSQLSERQPDRSAAGWQWTLDLDINSAACWVSSTFKTMRQRRPGRYWPQPSYREKWMGPEVILIAKWTDEEGH